MSGLRTIVVFSFVFLVIIHARPDAPRHPSAESPPRLAVRAVSPYEKMMDAYDSTDSPSPPSSADRLRPLDQTSPPGPNSMKASPPGQLVSSQSGGAQQLSDGNLPGRRVTSERPPQARPRARLASADAPDTVPVAQNRLLLAQTQEGPLPGADAPMGSRLNTQAQRTQPAPPVDGGQCIPGRYYGTGASLSSRPAMSAAVQRPRASRNKVAKRAVVQRRYVAGPPGTLNCRGPGGGAVSQATWRQVGTTSWLREYMTRRRDDFPKLGGFTALTRQEFLNDGTSNCQTGETCDVTPCVVLNLASVSPCDRQPALHVLAAQRNLKNFFDGFLDALQHAVGNAALTVNAVALNFYDDVNAQDYGGFQILTGIANFAVGLILPLAPVWKALLGMPATASDAPFFFPQHFIGSGLVYILTTSRELPDTTPDVAAKAGEYVLWATSRLSRIMKLGMTELMEGRTFGDKGFLDWTDDGSIMNFHGYKSDELVSFMTTQIINVVVNLLWTRMRVFIIGGWPCNSDPKLGQGPAEGGMCDDEGNAWFILYLKSDPSGNHFIADENMFSSKVKLLQHVPGLAWTNRRWGYVQPPPGMNRMGQPPYEGMSYKNVIRSSLYAWKANKGNKFNGKFADQRYLDLVRPQNGKRGAGSNFWEGYHIPVCHAVGIDPQMQFRDMVLQPYSRERQVRWCGPICSNPWGSTPDKADPETTKEFYNVAHLWGYRPIVEKCDSDPPWGTGPKIPLYKKPLHYLGKGINPQTWVKNPSK
ncbi:MAG: hypothetical protein M1823_002385 [Watsoniomyces obsoletus]|nr:MAG: hypothetical protein M1823_002385 [Watsoniomyces obsoletus]